MREHIGLYRGKRKDGRGWVCGYLSTRTIRTDTDVHLGYIIQLPTARLYDNVYYEVDKDTIGEYIGSPDMHGKGIFECDIVVTKQFNTPEKKYVVRYNKSMAAFVCVSSTNDLFYVPFDSDTAMFEVVGNIFDNPELIPTEQKRQLLR
jgi:yopX protein